LTHLLIGMYSLYRMQIHWFAYIVWIATEWGTRMPFQDDRVSRQTGKVPLPDLKQSELASGPLVAEDGLTHPVSQRLTSLDQEPSTDQFPIAGQFLDTNNMNLAHVLTKTLPRISDSTTSQRMPVVIKSTMKKAPTRALPRAAHNRRRLAVTLLGVLIFVLVAGLALVTVTPLGQSMGMDWNPLAQPGSSVLTNQSSGANNPVVQATATAVYHKQTDGYSGYSSASAPVVGNGAGSLNWPVGQCTFWANSRYHQLTGYWVSWSGNADQWAAGARAAGWHVSTSPHVPSIIVLMPYVQGASGYGHVAVVESMNGNTVHTSNMNWYANGGGWDRESFQDFTTGSGVSFVWK
jgi:surface antigen